MYLWPVPAMAVMVNSFLLFCTYVIDDVLHVYVSIIFFSHEGISHDEPEAPWSHMRQRRDVPLASTSNDNNGEIFFLLFG